MRKLSLLFVCLSAFLLTTTSCSPTSPSITETAITIDTTPETNETPASDCLGGVINPIGESIAEDFETVDYLQVIDWFCSGAEFEDILVALETEALTDTSASDMLQMLADGLTWDEIWQSVGVTD
jgi:hypothetical protein